LTDRRAKRICCIEKAAHNVCQEKTKKWVKTLIFNLNKVNFAMRFFYYTKNKKTHYNKSESSQPKANTTIIQKKIEISKLTSSSRHTNLHSQINIIAFFF
jgi:hypothetical protein